MKYQDQLKRNRNKYPIPKHGWYYDDILNKLLNGRKVDGLNINHTITITEAREIAERLEKQMNNGGNKYTFNGFKIKYKTGQTFNNKRIKK